MARFTELIIVVVLVFLCTIGHLETFSSSRLFSMEHHNNMVKRATNEELMFRIQMVGSLSFNSTVAYAARERRKIACFFVFDKEASAELNNNLTIARYYATHLAALTSRYTAHANILVSNAGTEIWSTGDQIPFTVGIDQSLAMPDFLTQFQTFLGNSQKGHFGTKYAVGVLISNKPRLVAGGYSQGPPCTTSGASIINYRPYPWSIAGLLAHELAHTLGVVHPFEIPFLCEDHGSALSFCTTPRDDCNCDSDLHPPEQCLMTFQFGRAEIIAPTFTSCDLEMMNQFSSNISCLIK